MAKQGEKKIKKITEKHTALNKTKSLFHPSEHGSEEAAYELCKHAALDKQVYWDLKMNCWYYYL